MDGPTRSQERRKHFWDLKKKKGEKKKGPWL